MSNDTVSLFLAMLAVLALLFVVGVAVVAVISRTRGLGPGLASLRDAVSDASLLLALAVATTCTLGSLYMSEVRHFVPCDMCWYQRIAMYPLVVILLVAVLRRDRAVWRYVLPLALIGAAVSTYHYLHERFPESVSTSCSLEASCSTLWIWEFHFLSIPGMAWVGFVTIATLMLIARSAIRRDDALAADAPDPDAPAEVVDPNATETEEVPA